MCLDISVIINIWIDNKNKDRTDSISNSQVYIGRVHYVIIDLYQSIANQFIFKQIFI